MTDEGVYYTYFFYEVLNQTEHGNRALRIQSDVLKNNKNIPITPKPWVTSGLSYNAVSSGRVIVSGEIVYKNSNGYLSAD